MGTFHNVTSYADITMYHCKPLDKRPTVCHNKKPDTVRYSLRCNPIINFGASLGWDHI